MRHAMGDEVAQASPIEERLEFEEFGVLTANVGSVDGRPDAAVFVIGVYQRRRRSPTLAVNMVRTICTRGFFH
jgi:hypothetical protein